MRILPKILFTLLVFSFSLFTFTSSVSAQYTCDQCGYCVGNEKPPDWDACVECVYEGDATNTPVQGRYFTVIGCLDTSPVGFVQKISQFVTAVAGGIIFIMLLYGSFTVLTSSGDPVKLTKGKSMLKSGILALLIIIFSVFILQIIGVEILALPGFG